MSFPWGKKGKQYGTTPSKELADDDVGLESGTTALH